MRKLHDLLQRFRRDERGAFAIIFALLGIVLIATAGAVVDFTSIEQARTRAQDALDSAALGLQKTIYTDGVTEATLQADAQELLTERLADESVTATVTGVTVTPSTGSLRINARLTIPTAFVALVGVSQVNASIVSEVARGSVDLEVAVALDTTGSMGGTKIADLITATNSLIDTIMPEDTDGPTSVRMALVPYSQAVNVGTYADAVRGAMQGPVNVNGVSWAGATKNISAAAWMVPSSSRDISGITKTSNARVTTSSNHGYVDGNFILITGVSGMTGVNNKVFTITRYSNTQFNLNASSNSWGTYSSSTSDKARRCYTATCEVQITTTTNHGFANGDTVYITGVGGMTEINGQHFTVSGVTATTFILSGVTGTAYTDYTSGGTVRKCTVSTCNLVVSVSAAPTRVLQASDNVYITGTNGISITLPSSGWGSCSAINAVNNGNGNNCQNPNVWAATPITTTTFSIPVYGPSTSGTWSSGGTVQCAMYGCTQQWVDRQSGSDTWFYPTTCVTERVGTNAYTEVGPDDDLMGANYRLSGSPCIAQTIVPLTTSTDDLHATANGMVASGSTGGHIGIAWAWYMLSPEFAYLWPADNQPAAYATGPDDVIKVVIIMTDGAYNTVYRNGVIAKNSITGSGGSDEHINLDSLNGSSLTQGAAYCAAMKTDADTTDSYNNPRVVVYTVGFDIASDTNAQTLLNGCATDADHAYLASNGSQLLAAFQDIANNISQLRVTE